MTLDSDLTAFAQDSESVIRYGRFKKLHDRIQECLDLTALSGEPICCSLEGYTGAGKTWLILDFAKEFSRSKTFDGTYVPVLYIALDSDMTPNGFCELVLTELGDPTPSKGSITSMKRRLKDLLADCHVELVILDEFQHMIAADTEKVMAKVTDLFKSLIKKTNIPF